MVTKRAKDRETFEKYRDRVLDSDYFESVFYPRFVKVKGLYLFRGHYSASNLAKWLKVPGILRNLLKMENTINHVHLDDLRRDHAGQRKIGALLRPRWIAELSRRFPRQKFVVRLSNGSHGWELGMWAKRVVKTKTKAKSKAG
jgi:hypothetical protein